MKASTICHMIPYKMRIANDEVTGAVSYASSPAYATECHVTKGAPAAAGALHSINITTWPYAITSWHHYGHCARHMLQPSYYATLNTSSSSPCKISRYTSYTNTTEGMFTSGYIYVNTGRIRTSISRLVTRTVIVIVRTQYQCSIEFIRQ